MFSATRRQQVYLPPTTPFFIICFSGVCNTSHEHMKLPLVAVIPHPPTTAQDLKYEFYEAVLRDAADSAAGKPETVWVVGEFDDGEPLFQRLQQEHGNVKKAVSTLGVREGKICKERKTLFEFSHIADVSHC